MNLSPDTLSRYFQENFESRDELGAAVSVWQGEEEVISLNGGYVTRDKTEEWSPDTLIPVWSATKGPAALTTLIALHEAGVNLNAPICEIWMELTAGEGRGLTIAQVLAHQSGLAALDPGNRPNIRQHNEVVKALETQEPFWPAGLAHGYHPRTYGALLEEIVKRVSDGKTISELWRQKVADPAGIDIFIGNLTEKEIDRLATIYPPSTLKPPLDEMQFYRALGDPESLSLWAFSSPSGMKGLSDINKIENLQMGIASLGGIASARGLGKFYAMLANGGKWKGVQIVPESIVKLLSNPITDGDDYTLLIPTAFSPGFMMDPTHKNSGDKIRQNFGPSKKAFGQPGAGGSHAFADPENGISFAYVMNQMQTGILPNEKSLGLVSLLYS